MTIDEQLCVTVQAISPVQEIGISHVGQEVFVIEPDNSVSVRTGGGAGSSWLIHLVCTGVSLEVQVSIHVEGNGQ